MYSIRREMCSLAFLSNIFKWRLWRSVLLGQFLSLLNCGTGISSQLLQGNYKVYIPTAQSFLNYVMLCLIFTTWLACKPGDRGLVSVLRDRGWKYLIIAIVDVEANFLVVKSFQYTTYTSIQLLDCFTIPTVLLLSWLCIKVRYGIVHVIGVCIALVGVGFLVYADIEQGRDDLQAKNRFLGDMLCITGAALYGVSNVAEEYVVKSYSIVEFLGMLGLFGSIVNGIQLSFLEKEEISTLNAEKLEEICLLLAYSACLLLLYITMPLVLQVSNATAVNISLLSTDVYALFVGLYLFHFQFHWLYFASFAAVILGVIIYNLEPISFINGFDSTNSDESLPSTVIRGQMSSSNQADYQAMKCSNGALTTLTASSTMSTSGCNSYPNVIYRDSRYDIANIGKVTVLDQQQQLQHSMQPQLEQQRIMDNQYNGYTQSQRNYSTLNCNANIDESSEQTSNNQNEYENNYRTRNGVPKFVWENEC